jgi:hypothetical protein
MAAVKAVVLELGGRYARGGLAGEPAPRFTLEHGLQEDDANLKVRLCELFRHIFVDLLQLKSKQCSVLLVEKLLVSRTLRDHVLSVLLKEFNVSHPLHTPHTPHTPLDCYQPPTILTNSSLLAYGTRHTALRHTAYRHTAYGIRHSRRCNLCLCSPTC